MGNIQKVLTNRVSGLLASLRHSGIKQVVLSPGSRSTPVAILLGKMQDEGQIKLYVDVDERSAAFFGLGIAKASGQPVLLVCTSGTAAANYYPAIWEADSTNVPLVVLTTDRPPELQEIGTPQTLDQPRMYSTAVKGFYQLPSPSAGDGNAELAYTDYIVQKAVDQACQHPCGPVHLNLPLRKPLMPDVDQAVSLPEQNILQTKLTPVLTLAAKQHLTRLFAGKKGLIVAGPVQDGHQNAAEIAEFSEQMNWPILADPLSGLRGYSHALSTGDQLFKAWDKLPADFQPEVIVRTGATLVSASMINWLANKSAPVVYLDADRSWKDHSLSTTERIAAAPAQIFPQLSELKPAVSQWFERWNKLSQTIRETLESTTSLQPLNEPGVASVISKNLPADATLFVSNSMPIRDIDVQFDPQMTGTKVLCNRGADGIDGVNSTALGVASQLQNNYLYIGDLAFFHDLTGLMMARKYDLDLTVIVQNNDGGGIFSILPQYQEKTQFEKVFGTPLDLKISAIADMYDATYYKATTAGKLADVIRQQPHGLTIVEVVVPRQAVPEQQDHLKAAVADRLQEFLDGNHS